MPELKANNPEYSDFWNNKYLNNQIGWDLGKPTPVFVNWVKNLSSKNNKILIPGCGNGYDAIALASYGQLVYALDFAKAPLDRLKISADEHNVSVETICSNYFDINNKYFNTFDYILEYTFFCAIPISLREEYVKNSHNLLKDDGEIIGLLLPINKSQNHNDGPPYGINLDLTLSIFEKYFNINKIEKSPHTIEARRDSEIFINLIKKK